MLFCGIISSIAQANVAFIPLIEGYYRNAILIRGPIKVAES